jgi:hypothetical protein
LFTVSPADWDKALAAKNTGSVQIFQPEAEKSDVGIVMKKT